MDIDKRVGARSIWPLLPIMNFNGQNRHCHAERSEASLCRLRETLRFAQGDKLFPILVVKIHNRHSTAGVFC
jgi:hypothetical protein